MRGKEAVLVFIIGSFILGFAANPNLGNELLNHVKGISGEFGGFNEINLNKLSETYESSYISKYIWKNYSNKKIRLSDVSMGIATSISEGHGLFRARSLEGVDYYFYSTQPGTIDRKNAVYLIDSENVIEEAEKKYSSPKFTITGILKKKKIDFGGFFSHDYENAVVVVATNIKIHP